MTDTKTRAVLMMVRQALLMLVEAVESYLEISPTTAQIRKQLRN